MKTLLICPGNRPAVRYLAHTGPLAALPVLGKPLVVRWLEQLAASGATEVRILAADQADKIRAVVGNGGRWNLRVEVLNETRELTPQEALAKYGTNAGAPAEVMVMDHFPGFSEHPIFDSYAHWFNALRALLSRVVAAGASEMRELKPGVWVSARARVSPSAELRAPCWIGANTAIGPDAVIGPMAVLEDRVMVEAEAEVSNSLVAAETFVGPMAEVKNSLADGSLLINWRSNSCIRVPDPFQMCSLAKREHNIKTGNWLGRAAAVLALALTLPIALAPVVRAKIRRRPAFQRRVAVRPQFFKNGEPRETVVYHELTGVKGWLRYWPQLWSIVKGDFVWVGNRPLSPAKAAKLTSDFERLWLSAPTGMISLAYAEGVREAFGDQTRVCASLYAMKANWRLDVTILARTFLPMAKKTVLALF